MFLILILLLTTSKHSEIDHLFLFLCDNFSALGPVPLEQVLLSDYLALDQLIIHAFETRIITDQLHDFIERSIADIDGMLKEVEDLK